MKYKELTKKEYQQICHLLNIDPHQDIEATDYLDQHLNTEYIKNSLLSLKERIVNKQVFIFAPGPSLTEAIVKIKKILKTIPKPIIVAVDGATVALLENKLPIDIIVTDLDGSIPAIKASYKEYNSVLVIHAHGDNKSKLISIEDLLSQKNIIGSTQTNNTTKVKNFGGFTDGDRAVYLVANFNPKNVFLFAFDFGEIIGKYSKPESYTSDKEITERKKIKLTIAKELLAKLYKRFPKIKIYNCAPVGEEIQNIQTINFEELITLLNN